MENEGEAVELSSATERIIDDYRSKLPVLDAFRLQLEALIQVLLTSEDRPVHHIESRCKSVDGFRAKTARKTYDNPMQQMTDMVGLRIIMYFNSDVTFAAQLIETEFVVDRENSEDKRVPAESDRFGYASHHLVISLDERRSALREWQPFNGLRAEIQIRTVLQHAWAGVDHLLDYKKSPGLSEVGRRRLNRIAATLEGMDDEFEVVRVGEDQQREAKVDQRTEGGNLQEGA